MPKQLAWGLRPAIEIAVGMIERFPGISANPDIRMNLVSE
jgi:hypothetical protein